MKLLKRVLLSIIGIVAVIGISYGIYYLVHYKYYDDYKDCLVNYTDEEGKDFTALEDSDPATELTGDGYVLAAARGSLKLYINTATADVAVYDTRNGEITRSNPTQAEVDADTVANDVNKQWMRSQLIVDFYDGNRKLSTYDSYTYATSLNQFSVQLIENGVRVTYQIGDLESSTGVVPIYISKERLEKYMSLMDESAAKKVKSLFRESDTVPGFYELSTKLQSANIEKNASLRKLNQYLTDAGYTEADYVSDMESSGVDFDLPIAFTIPLDYVLSGDDNLEASIVTSEITEQGGGELKNIQMLRYFGAQSSAVNGYILVPNGCGSIINFNNGKTSSTISDYSSYVYGLDPVVSDYTVTENLQTVRLPMFGLYNSDKQYSIFATIESGDSLASINASSSGRLNSYNYAYSLFAVRGVEMLDSLGATEGTDTAAMTVIEKNIYDTELKIRYSFLTSDYDGYSGMARYYRERLVSEGKLTALSDESGDIPFYYDVLGGVKETASFIGIRYLKIIPMTTFKEAGKIVDELSEQGISNQVINYQGWFNGGYYQDVANKVKVIGKLGGKSALESLRKKIEAAGGKLYGDVSFQKVTWISKRYKYATESAKYYSSGYTVSLGQISPVSLRQVTSLGYKETLYNIISPKFLVRYVDKFIDRYDTDLLTGISLRDLGDTLSSDKKRTEFISRDEAETIVKAQFEKLSETGGDIMVSGGNSYSLPYADDIINAPDTQSDFYIIDAQVPFYQMIIHGYINYTGASLNLGASYNENDALLTLLSQGAAPHFTYSWEESSLMKYTGLNRDYSTTFSTWKDDSVDLYNKVNEVEKLVSGSPIHEHKILADNVTSLTYENGVVVTVNQSDADYMLEDGTVVAAQSYSVKQ